MVRSEPTRPSAEGRAISGAAPGTARRGIFTYGVAASYIGKDEPYDPAKHVFHFDPSSRPQSKRPDERPESGQDAFFVSRVGDTESIALAVADGVGGWMESGIDPADFSHGLCESMATAAYEFGKTPEKSGTLEKSEKESASASTSASASASSLPPLAPRRLMEVGYEAVCNDPAIAAGGSTAIVGVLSPEGELDVANLGDSGFIHLRLNGMHAASEPQTHAFNTPFQLSLIPPDIMARMAAFGGAQLSDQPADAEVSRHALRHGDVLVFASDGVWDNLFNQDILKLVSRAMAVTGAWRTSRRDAGVAVASPAALHRLTHPRPEETRDGITLQSLIATQITAAAKAASLNTKRNGPFAKEVLRYYPYESWSGGKVDDICVVVAVVAEESRPDDDKTKMPPVKSKL